MSSHPDWRMMELSEELSEKRMSDPIDTLDLALRLRQDAQATALPEYVNLMLRAAEELEAYARLKESAPHQPERRAG
jgi:hypothetical protein